MVGLTYFSGVEPLLDSAPELIDVLEIEPQTLWYQPDGRLDDYRIDEACVERIRRLPFRKLLHGVGFPVGGAEPPPKGQTVPLLRTVEALAPLWVSEHLSFNRARNEAGDFYTGFLLPPRQTFAGATAAVRSIRSMADVLPVPFAVENGVNYLQPRSDELPDGDFVGSIIHGAECGIVLDLHNLWCNERNGRQSIEGFLTRIPLDRVWEIHLAGGSSFDGYWIDSHSGAMPHELAEIARRIIPRLPNLRAVIFELFPEYLPLVGLDVVRAQLEVIREMLPSPSFAPDSKPPVIERCVLVRSEEGDEPSPREWEDALGALVVGSPAARALDNRAEGCLYAELAEDPGIAVLRKLVADFRASMIAGALKLTLRLLLLALGRDEVDRIFAAYWRASTPRLFASAEAEAFGTYLLEHGPFVPYLDEVLRFELSVIDVLLQQQPRVVDFGADPLVILRALGQARLPESPKAGAFQIEITPHDTGPRKSWTFNAAV